MTAQKGVINLAQNDEDDSTQFDGVDKIDWWKLNITFFLRHWKLWLFQPILTFAGKTDAPLWQVQPYSQILDLGNCDKFYFTFEFEVRMWVLIYQIFEKDQIPIHHL